MFPAPFAKSFVINRCVDAGRLHTLTPRLRALGADAERFPAIADPSPERSCAMTHAEVVREARRRNLTSVLILEDDVVFHPYLPALWPRVAAQLACVPYDVFYLYRWESPRDEWPCDVVKAGGTLCTHCYAVHARYFDGFIGLVESNLHRAVDVVLRDTREAAFYATSVNLAGQDAGISLIDHLRKPVRWRRSDG
ncbi:MAG TPA: hypothetical protein VKU19_20935 [Bryobacteraceae bacterium]|nr:hypothetical protein [Bryobacteraceae bacterium]